MTGIGFFAPLPIAIMIPFMAAQSAAMAEAFGSHFQYGKRKISSMSNEEFNALTSEKLFGDTAANIKAMMPKMLDAMNNVGPTQTKIFEHLIQLIPQTVNAIGNAITGQSTTSETTTVGGASIPVTPGANFISGAQGVLNLLESTGLLNSNNQSPSDAQWVKLLQTITQGIGPIYNPKITTGVAVTAPQPSPVTEKELRSGETEFSISPEDAPTTGFIKSTVKEFTKTKIRAPSSIVTQYNKYKAEIRAHQLLKDKAWQVIKNNPASNSWREAYNKAKNNIAILQGKMKSLENKYIL